MKTKGDELRNFSWQTGYGVFAVSRSGIDKVHQYIVNQKEHHQEKGFKNELRGLLTKHDLEWDERYVWD